MNTVLVISICAWGLAQLAKVSIVLIREKRLDFRYFVAGGGMPSAHSATVCALATAVAMMYGFGSVAFGITAVLAVIVMYDAAGLRQAVSRQSVILNRIIRELPLKRPRGEMERELRELIGHTPVQVFVGAALGILVAWLWLTVGAV